MTHPNDPAFPTLYKDGGITCEGFTKREFLAGISMQGILSALPEGYSFNPTSAVLAAVEHADALLLELARTESKPKDSLPPGGCL